MPVPHNGGLAAPPACGSPAPKLVCSRQGLQRTYICDSTSPSLLAPLGYEHVDSHTIEPMYFQLSAPLHGTSVYGIVRWATLVVWPFVTPETFPVKLFTLTQSFRVSFVSPDGIAIDGPFHAAGQPAI